MIFDLFGKTGRGVCRWRLRHLITPSVAFSTSFSSARDRDYSIRRRWLTAELLLGLDHSDIDGRRELAMLLASNRRSIMDEADLAFDSEQRHLMQALAAQRRSSERPDSPS